MANNALPGPVSMTEDSKTTTWNARGWLSPFIKRKDTNPSPFMALGFSTRSDAQSRSDSSKFGKDSPGPIVLNINAVVADLTIYKCFCLPSLGPGVEVTNLPNFDDITRYNVPSQVQEDLWNLEAQRLVKAVTQKESPRFQGSADLVPDSKDAYNTLANLLDKVLQSLSVVSHDRERLLEEYHVSSFDSDKLEESKGLLGYLLRKESNDGGDQNQRGEAQGHAAKGTTEDFFAFIDYCTAMLARYLCSAVEGNSVHINIIAHMARIAAKVKAVSANLRTSAQQSLGRPIPPRYFEHLSDEETTEVGTIYNHGPVRHSVTRVKEQGQAYAETASRAEGWDGKEPRVQFPRRPQTSDSGLLSAVGVETKKKELRILYYREVSQLPLAPC